MRVQVLFAKEMTTPKFDGSLVQCFQPEHKTPEGFTEVTTFFCEGVKGLNKPGLYDADLAPARFGKNYVLVNFRPVEAAQKQPALAGAR